MKKASPNACSAGQAPSPRGNEQTGKYDGDGESGGAREVVKDEVAVAQPRKRARAQDSGSSASPAPFVPAKAGTQLLWIPACAGMSGKELLGIQFAAVNSGLPFLSLISAAQTFSISATRFAGIGT